MILTKINIIYPNTIVRFTDKGSNDTGSNDTGPNDKGSKNATKGQIFIIFTVSIFWPLGQLYPFIYYYLGLG